MVGDALIPKNVLAFPADLKFPRPDLKKPPLGEIYLNPLRIAKEELEIVSLREMSRSDRNWKLDYMLTHGFLHLLGYDHIKKNDRIVMEEKEAELLSAISKS